MLVTPPGCSSFISQSKFKLELTLNPKHQPLGLPAVSYPEHFSYQLSVCVFGLSSSQSFILQSMMQPINGQVSRHSSCIVPKIDEQNPTGEHIYRESIKVIYMGNIICNIICPMARHNLNLYNKIHQQYGNIKSLAQAISLSCVTFLHYQYYSFYCSLTNVVGQQEVIL